MGRHRAPEDAPVEHRNGAIRVWLEYCQPFYKRYRKGIIAVGSAMLVAGQAVVSDGITVGEWGFIITAALGAAGVIQVPNATNKKVIKDDKV